MKKAILVVLVLLIALASTPLFANGGKEESGEKVYRVGVIPKFIAEDYFIAVENGFREAEMELGNIRVDWVGDTMSQCSAANQQTYIQSFIDKGYDAILVSALDPSSYADTLKEAMDKGIKVITWDADVQPDARDYFVNQTEFDKIGIAVLKGIAGDLNSYSSSNKADVALVTTTPDSPNQNAWIAAIIDDYVAGIDGDYSHLNLLKDNIVYAGNDQGTADEKIKAMLNANPNIKGIIALSSNTVPAVSSARDQLGISESIKIVGISVPETSKKDMEDGNISALVLWQPFDLGYLTLYLTYDILTGNAPTGSVYKSPLSGTAITADFRDITKNVDYPAEGHMIMDNNTLILAEPVVFNLDNLPWFRGYPTDSHGMEYFKK